MNKYNVLFINGSKSFSGAIKSLSVNIEGLGDLVNATVLCAKGTSSRFLMKCKCEVFECPGLAKFDNTEHGYYRKKRWLILARELYYIPSTIFFAFKLRRNKIDIIHINEVTDLISGIICKFFLKKPLVVHVRSRQNVRKGVAVKIQKKLLERYADRIVAIDDTVLKTLTADKCHVVHNSLSLKENICRKRGTFYPKGSDHLRVGFVANLMKDKGIYDLVDAAIVLKKEKVPCRLVIYGENLHKNIGGIRYRLLKRLGYIYDVRNEVLQRLRHYGLEEIVEFKGFCESLTEIYNNIDVVCFPSHLDAVGRPVIEGALYGIPSIVAFRSTPEIDTFINNKTGLAVPEGDVNSLAEAIKNYALNPQKIYQHGLQAKALARINFNSEINAKILFNIYSSLLK
jgi:glycosyltransferase involved in cell wall biosynthesis